MHAEKQQAKISIEPLGRTNRDSIDYVVPPPHQQQYFFSDSLLVLFLL